MVLNKNSQTTFCIVGLGLMGGSYARALTARGYTVTAITKEQESLDFALQEGFITKGATTPDASLLQEANMIVFALYPHTFLEWLTDYQHLLKAGTIITDVTGVKGSIVYAIQSMLREDVEFIAAHPMAGREVYGVQNSDASIFKGANYIVTPTEKNTPEAIELCKELGRELGFARISCLSPEEHDDMIGFVSQLTHCIAVTLMTCTDCEELVDYTGDSFRDLTRIAAINDEMWSELFLMNKEPLLNNMEKFKTEFDRLYTLLKAEDREEIREMMRLSTARRQLFNKPKAKTRS
ncbi:MAG: prephenate dehydrogenase [Clostridia bacterium]|nr:prephenate dehydrogenase [Clostridia bacterium]